VPPPIRVADEKSARIAVALEVVPGLLLQTFGLGHLYAGNWELCVFFVVGYWVILAANLALVPAPFVYATLPLCWVGIARGSGYLASESCRTR